MHRFRFQHLEIWQEAVAIGGELCQLADRFEERRLFRFADQLRGASLSVSNNIAEGSGSSSKKDFQNFLNIARRSVFENASMLLFFVALGYLSDDQVNGLLDDLDRLSSKILNFSRSL